MGTLENAKLALNETFMPDMILRREGKKFAHMKRSVSRDQSENASLLSISVAAGHLSPERVWHAQRLETQFATEGLTGFRAMFAAIPSLRRIIRTIENPLPFDGFVSSITAN